MIVRNPLQQFRSISAPAVNTKATVTLTAVPTTQQSLTGTFTPTIVVQNITACVAGTNQSGPIQVNLIDGTTGSTPIVWAAVMAAGSGNGDYIFPSGLMLPCTSGYATLEFAAGPGAGNFQTVAMSGIVQGYGDI
jgi:hypothetical protein